MSASCYCITNLNIQKVIYFPIPSFAFHQSSHFLIFLIPFTISWIFFTSLSTFINPSICRQFHRSVCHISHNSRMQLPIAEKGGKERGKINHLQMACKPYTALPFSSSSSFPDRDAFEVFLFRVGNWPSSLAAAKVIQVVGRASWQQFCARHLATLREVPHILLTFSGVISGSAIV